MTAALFTIYLKLLPTQQFPSRGNKLLKSTFAYATRVRTKFWVARLQKWKPETAVVLLQATQRDHGKEFQF